MGPVFGNPWAWVHVGPPGFDLGSTWVLPRWLGSLWVLRPPGKDPGGTQGELGENKDQARTRTRTQAKTGRTGILNFGIHSFPRAHFLHGEGIFDVEEKFLPNHFGAQLWPRFYFAPEEGISSCLRQILHFPRILSWRKEFPTLHQFFTFSRIMSRRKEFPTLVNFALLGILHTWPHNLHMEDENFEFSS